MSPTSGTGSQLRERRRLRMVDEIERTALDLFKERSFDTVSLDEIADVVGISRRTFFRYFPSKNDLILHNVRRHAAELVAALSERPESEPALEALKSAYLTMADSYQRERDVMQLRFRILEESPSLRAQTSGELLSLADSVGEILAVKLNLTDPLDIRPRLMAITSMSAVLLAVEVWLAGDGPLAPLIGSNFDVLVRGFADANECLP